MSFPPTHIYHWCVLHTYKYANSPISNCSPVLCTKMSHVKHVVLFQDDFENTAKFKVSRLQKEWGTHRMCEGAHGGWRRLTVSLCAPQVQLFSELGFQGSVLAVEDSVASLEDGFSVASCKVLAGRWVILRTVDKISVQYLTKQLWVLWYKSQHSYLKQLPANSDF